MWNLEEFSGRAAARDEAGVCLTYDELSRENKRLAAALNGRCLVFVLCSNTLGSLVGYTSCIQNKAVPLLLSKDLDSELLGHLLSVYKPKYLWLPVEMRFVYRTYRQVYEAFDYALLRTAYEEEYPLADELCLLLTTSGSTGSPKLVRQSYQNVLSNARVIVEYLELNQTERPITTLPMNYTYGLSIINSHLLVGAEILFTEKGLMQKEFWDFFKEWGATSFGGVPYTYEMLDKLRFTRMELPSLRTMTQAGGKLQLDLHRKFAAYAQEKGKRFYVMYGQAEATARMSYLPYQMALEKCGSMGIAIPGGVFSIIDEEGSPIRTPHTTGELVYEGPNVTLGYAECGEDLALGDERRGRLETGDMAEFDEDGYYFITGRKKRFLKIFGNRVNLDEIDRLVKGRFEGIDCASTGQDDALHLYITDESLKETVQKFIAEKTGLHFTAFTVRTIPSIPRNDSGKVLYQVLEHIGES